MCVGGGRGRGRKFCGNFFLFNLFVVLLCSITLSVSHGVFPSMPILAGRRAATTTEHDDVTGRHVVVDGMVMTTTTSCISKAEAFVWSPLADVTSTSSVCWTWRGDEKRAVDQDILETNTYGYISNMEWNYCDGDESSWQKYLNTLFRLLFLMNTTVMQKPYWRMHYTHHRAQYCTAGETAAARSWPRRRERLMLAAERSAIRRQKTESRTDTERLLRREEIVSRERGTLWER